MKRVIASIIIAGTVLAMATPSYASDWDKAGKALAIVEGARILTGGNLDLIGNLTGINGRSSWNSPSRGQYREPRPAYAKAHHRSYAKAPRHYPERAWVPHYVWKKKYVPEHEEYYQDYGTVIVEGHYIKYRIEKGGHWE